MEQSQQERQARRWVEEWDTDTWADTIRELSAPAVVYEETGTGQRFEGIDALMTGLEGWKTAFPDCTGEIVRAVSAGDTVVLEIIWRGTQTGPLAGAGGVLPGSGRPMEIRATMWQTWEAGKIVHKFHHLDIQTLLAQVAPVPDTAGSSV
jgi:steroid delta-isomerase-like uncharacterized protein